MSATTFRVGIPYSNQEIIVALGCNPVPYLRKRGGEIVAACVRWDDNPDALNEIWVGPGIPRSKLADDFLTQCAAYPDSAVPLFLKIGNPTSRNSDVWRYEGRFRATGEEASWEEVQKRQRSKDQVMRVIFVERVGD